MLSGTHHGVCVPTILAQLAGFDGVDRLAGVSVVEKAGGGVKFGGEVLEGGGEAGGCRVAVQPLVEVCGEGVVASFGVDAEDCQRPRSFPHGRPRVPHWRSPLAAICAPRPPVTGHAGCSAETRCPHRTAVDTSRSLERRPCPGSGQDDHSGATTEAAGRFLRCLTAAALVSRHSVVRP